MKFLGIDYGTRTLGIAVSDPEGAIAFPRQEIVNDGAVVEKIAEMARVEGVQAIVVGDTRTLSGAENPVTKAADAFIEKLSAAGVRVERGREAWSSAEAARFAPKGKTHDNSAAAAIILQRFLDMKQG